MRRGAPHISQCVVKTFLVSVGIVNFSGMLVCLPKDIPSIVVT